MHVGRLLIPDYAYLIRTLLPSSFIFILHLELGMQIKRIWYNNFTLPRVINMLVLSK